MIQPYLVSVSPSAKRKESTSLLVSLGRNPPIPPTQSVTKYCTALCRISSQVLTHIF